MNNEQKEMLLKLQQGELDGVVMYQKLAELEELQYIKNELLEMAADEGRHASLLKSYTGEVLKPSSGQAEKIVEMLKNVGKVKTFEMMAEGEFKGGPVYEELGKNFERLKDIAKDEVKHGNMLKGFISE
ncbi:ferritin family protein [Terrisporobacter sp.]